MALLLQEFSRKNVCWKNSNVENKQKNSSISMLLKSIIFYLFSTLEFFQQIFFLKNSCKRSAMILLSFCNNFQATLQRKSKLRTENLFFVDFSPTPPRYSSQITSFIIIIIILAEFVTELLEIVAKLFQIHRLRL